MKVENLKMYFLPIPWHYLLKGLYSKIFAQWFSHCCLGISICSYSLFSCCPQLIAVEYHYHSLPTTLSLCRQQASLMGNIQETCIFKAHTLHGVWKEEQGSEYQNPHLQCLFWGLPYLWKGEKFKGEKRSYYNIWLRKIFFEVSICELGLK